MLKTILTAFSIALALPATSQAQAQYSAADIEAHFSDEIATLECPPGRACFEKTRTRGTGCLGSRAVRCKGGAQARINPHGFDLLITFELNSHQLSAQARRNLAEFANALDGPLLKNIQFNVDGHADARGTEAYNLALSRRRAVAVVRHLKRLGVDPDRLFAKAYGEAKPRVADPFSAVNRRVETTIRKR